jgi:hypothetical protein
VDQSSHASPLALERRYLLGLALGCAWRHVGKWRGLRRRGG